MKMLSWLYAHAPFFFALSCRRWLHEEEKHNFEKEEKTGVAVLISETVYESSENILDFTTLALSLFFFPFFFQFLCLFGAPYLFYLHFFIFVSVCILTKYTKHFFYSYQLYFSFRLFTC